MDLIKFNEDVIATHPDVFNQVRCILQDVIENYVEKLVIFSIERNKITVCDLNFAINKAFTNPSFPLNRPMRWHDIYLEVKVKREGINSFIIDRYEVINN